jgi:hypothetical protein
LKVWYSHLRGPALALPVVKRVDQRSVVPALDVIVWPVVDLDLDGVPVVVDEKDDRVSTKADHGRHILCGDLRANRQYHRLVCFEVQSMILDKNPCCRCGSGSSWKRFVLYFANRDGEDIVRVVSCL